MLIPTVSKVLRTRSGLKSHKTAAAFELDGEWVGKLPVTFSIERKELRVVVP